MGLLPTPRLVRLVLLGAPLWLLAYVLPGGWGVAVAYLLALAVAAAADRARLPHRAQLEAQRTLPPRFALGEEQEVTIALKSTSRRALRVRAREELPASLDRLTALAETRLPAGGEARWTYRVRANRRGDDVYGRVVLRLTTNLGLLGCEMALELPDAIRVYPRFRGAEHYRLLAMLDVRRDVVHRPRRIRGLGTDFESLRAYSPGEDLRQVDWKASARKGALVSRNRQVEKGQQLAILLDAGRMMAQTVADSTKLEHAIAATVMLSYVVQQRGDGLAVASFSNRIETFLPTVRGQTVVARVLEAVYKIEARPVESDYWQVMAAILSRLKRRSLVVMLTDVLDSSASAGLVANLSRAARKHLVLCVALVEPRVRELGLRPPATVLDTYRQAAAADFLRRRRLALEHMRARGILVLETDPAHLSADLVRRYLEIRQANLQ